jgi:hypothetical protein
MEVEANPDANSGTVLEPVEDIRAALGGGLPAATRIEPRPDPGEPGADAGQGPTEIPHRPVLRPSVPVLVVLDDGEQESGEVHRLRAGVTLIGRVEGQIQLPHDALVSSRHAEISGAPTARSCAAAAVCCSRDHSSSWEAAGSAFSPRRRQPAKPARLLSLAGR